MPGCCVVNCKNRTQLGFRLFGLPSGDAKKIRRELWRTLIGRNDLTSNSKICEVHFSETQFEQKRADGRKLLRPDAVPDLLLVKSVDIPVGEKMIIKEVVNQVSEPEERIESSNGKRIRLESENCTDGDDDDDEDLTFISGCSSENRDGDENQEGSFYEDVDTMTSDPAVQIEKLKKTLRVAWSKCHHYKKQLKRKDENLSKIFNEDQLEFLRIGSHRGTEWSEDTLNRAIKLYLACGANGYEELRRQKLPFPSIRTLQHRLRHLKFRPGILYDVFRLMEVKVASFKPQEKHATLLIDEMAIKSGLQYDSSLSSVVGRPTVANASGNNEEMATHALVFMLAGVSSRWKQTVGYDFTGNSFLASEILQRIMTIIEKSHEIGITVRVVISDMGPQNRGIWRLLNIVANRHSEIVNYTPHPCLENEKLFIMPDPVHLFKNIAAALRKGHKFYLSDVIVQSYGLPSNEISLEPARKVFELDEQDVIKLCPRLKENVLQPNHFETMNVGLSVTLLSHDVAAAIRFHIAANNISLKHETTAWFLTIMHNWFQLMTSRFQQLALSHKEMEEYEVSINFLHSFINIIRHITTEDKCWKPFQTGCLLATQTALDYQQLYLGQEDFKYVMLGRLTQDCLENLFSVIRSRKAVPDAQEFRSVLRLVCLSQFECHIKHGSYEISDNTHLVRYCQSTSEIPPAIQEETNDEHIDNLLSDVVSYRIDGQPLSDTVQAALYNFLGALLFKIKRNHKLCDVCWCSVLDTSAEPSKLRLFTELREFKENENLCYASQDLFKFIVYCELSFRHYWPQLFENKMTKEMFVKHLLQVEPNKVPSEIPSCHGILQYLVKMFVNSRFYFSLREVNKQNKQILKSSLDSRSLAMREFVGRKKK